MFKRQTARGEASHSGDWLPIGQVVAVRVGSPILVSLTEEISLEFSCGPFLEGVGTGESGGE